MFSGTYKKVVALKQQENVLSLTKEHSERKQQKTLDKLEI